MDSKMIEKRVSELKAEIAHNVKWFQQAKKTIETFEKRIPKLESELQLWIAQSEVLKVKK